MLFDLECNISSWADHLRSGGKLDEEEVGELERQLREQVDELTGNGLSEEEAFLIGARRLGRSSKLSGLGVQADVDTNNLWNQFVTAPAAPGTGETGWCDIGLVVLFALLAGTVAKLPTFWGLDTDSVAYFKNMSFYVLPFMVLFFAIKHNLEKKLIGYVAGIYAVTAAIINLYPSYAPNHTALLTGVHLPIMLWLVAGVAYMGKEWRSKEGRMNFIRFTGECLIYGSLIVLGLMVLVMFIFAIFDSIGVDAERFFENWLIFYVAGAAAMITVYLVETRKSMVENFAPVLAGIFSPLFLITMVIFLAVFVISGKSPFVERNFLIAFDLMLVLVLGMVIYSITARPVNGKVHLSDYMNAALILVAVIVDGVALSAIVFRLAEFGISPNKLAALGENILLLVNLLALLWLYVRYFRNQTGFEIIETWQTRYLTVYALWMAVVVFGFPLFFGFQ